MMETLKDLFPVLARLIPAAGTLFLVLVGLFVIHRFVLKAYTASTGKKFRKLVKDPQEGDPAKDEQERARIEQQLQRLARVIAHREDRASEKE